MTFVEPVSEPTTPRSARPSFYRSHWFHLTLITLLGALLRFTWLSRPAIWGDEAATFRRVCSTFQDLVDQLAVAGFGPLHYLLYWWMGQHTTLTPTVMRLPPAIAGTLMVPAMYFLARQLVSKPTSMLVALFTACSAFMLNYSRDAKMYSELWLFVALHMGCLFWWLRVRTRISWWSWVTSGIAMLGLQMVSLALLPIELLIVLTARDGHWMSLWHLARWIFVAPVVAIHNGFQWFRQGYDRVGPRLPRWRYPGMPGFHWPPILWFIVGCAIIGAGPYIYYTKYNVYKDRVYDETEEGFDWHRTGINWVGPYNRGRTGLDHVRYAGTAFLYAWEWPRAVHLLQIDRQTLRLLAYSGIGAGTILLLGVAPWRRRTFRECDDAPKVPRLLWITLWIALPVYGFYVASLPNAVWPIDWLTNAILVKPPDVSWSDLLHPGTTAATQQSATLLAALVWSNVNVVVVSIAAGALVLWLILPPYDWRQRLRSLSQVGVTFGIVFALSMLLRWQLKRPPDSVWIPRYLGFIWPAFAIGVCVLLMRIPTRPIRWAMIGLILSLNLTLHWARVFAGSEPPTELMARDVLASQPPGNTSRVYYRFNYRGPGDPGSGLLDTPPGNYYLAVLSGRKPTPREIIRGFGRVNNRVWPEIWIANFFLSLDSFVTSSLRNADNVQQLIIWDQQEPTDPKPKDRLHETLSPGWKLTHENVYAVRDHWTWRDLIKARRRVFERVPVPASQPTTGQSAVTSQ